MINVRPHFLPPSLPPSLPLHLTCGAGAALLELPLMRSLSLRLEILAPPLPLPLASGLWSLISPQAPESSLKGTCARVQPSPASSLAHLRRPQSGQINNVGASIPPATPVIGWKCGCCSTCPVSLGNQIVRVRTHKRNNPNTRGEAGDPHGRMSTVSRLYHESSSAL